LPDSLSLGVSSLALRDWIIDLADLRRLQQAWSDDVMPEQSPGFRTGSGGGAV